MSRTLSVARMQLVTKWTYVGSPLLILAVTFILSLAIFALIPVSAPKFSGGSQAPLWYFMVLGIQGMTMAFPFSQALSISRRAYFQGTLGVFSALAVVMTVIYLLGAMVERATGGWGMNGYFFNIPWISEGPWYGTGVFFFAAMMLMFILGFWFATIFKRWGATGLLVSLIGTGVLLVGIIAVTTVNEWWGSVGAWSSEQSPLTLGLWAVVLSALLAGGSFLTLRRATP
ncbi:hypothetical protein PSET11_01619 [Arthrobacter ulcerisalmonis]|uniref:ABC-2 family transporter protein n=1 Tax=Arthrobacter ulcerisalmonis TaxID=2483813 RepID=A0A3P5WVL7_9MICC|nr:hypothetical protein [Arthrobacter ulcerisalmonis]VDC25825.1 hypothetical protein PSET11_01619 [Arthrobacter ulcerisalmonis]